MRTALYCVKRSTIGKVKWVTLYFFLCTYVACPVKLTWDWSSPERSLWYRSMSVLGSLTPSQDLLPCSMPPLDIGFGIGSYTTKHTFSFTYYSVYCVHIPIPEASSSSLASLTLWSSDWEWTQLWTAAAPRRTLEERPKMTSKALEGSERPKAALKKKEEACARPPEKDEGRRSGSNVGCWRSGWPSRRRRHTPSAEKEIILSSWVYVKGIFLSSRV